MPVVGVEPTRVISTRDFESFASAIPPHRLIFNFGTFVPVSEDWRDAQEGCKKSCFDKLSKFNEHS